MEVRDLQIFYREQWVVLKELSYEDLVLLATELETDIMLNKVDLQTIKYIRLAHSCIMTLLLEKQHNNASQN